MSGLIVKEPGRIRSRLRIFGWILLLGVVLASLACASATALPTATGFPVSPPTETTAPASVVPSPTAAANSAIPPSTSTSVPSPSPVPPTATAIPSLTSATLAQPIRVVAAENFYGDVASQIGGDRVTVVTILSDPSTDPHEYETNADDAKAVANGQVLVKNSLGYDAFVDHLTSASPRPDRLVVDVGALTGHVDGDNPHLWYDPATMPRVAQRLSAVFTQLDPADRAYFAERLGAFSAREKAVGDAVTAIQAKYKGAKVIATEPVFNYMAEALGLDVVDKEGAFQKAVEEGNDPPAAAVVAFRAQLASHTIKVLIYNSQAVTPMTKQMQAVATQNNVKIVAVSETEPSNVTYQQWMIDQLTKLQLALGG